MLQCKAAGFVVRNKHPRPGSCCTPAGPPVQTWESVNYSIYFVICELWRYRLPVAWYATKKAPGGARRQQWVAKSGNEGTQVQQGQMGALRTESCWQSGQGGNRRGAHHRGRAALVSGVHCVDSIGEVIKLFGSKRAGARAVLYRSIRGAA